MDKKTRQLDLEFIKDHITVKTYPVIGMDIYEMRIYYKGAYLKSVEVDGIELEMWRYKDTPDPDSHTYDELEENHPETWEKMQERPIKDAGFKKEPDEEGFKKLEEKELCSDGTESVDTPRVDEVERKEGWD